MIALCSRRFGAGYMRLAASRIKETDVCQGSVMATRRGTVDAGILGWPDESADSLEAWESLALAGPTPLCGYRMSAGHRTL